MEQWAWCGHMTHFAMGRLSSLSAPCLFIVYLSFLKCLCASINIVSINPRDGSISGGTKVTIIGEGFETLLQGNTTVLFGVDIDCSPIDWDAISSSELVCTTVPYPRGWEGGYSSGLIVNLVANGTTYTSTSRFTYRWSRTSELQYIRPQAVPSGELIAFTGVKMPNNADGIASVSLGRNGHCNLTNPDTNQYYSMFRRDGYTWFQCRVNAPPGFYNLTVLLADNSGISWRHSQSFLLGPKAQLIQLEVFADVHDVYPFASFYTGNELITINGVGFGSNMSEVSVTIDNLPCPLVNLSDECIQCVTLPIYRNDTVASDNGTFSLVESGLRFIGSRGVRAIKYNNITGVDVNDLYSSEKYPDQPDEYSLFVNFEPVDISRDDIYGEVYEAFFTPVVSNVHHLWGSTDDRMEILIAQGTNISDLSLVAWNYQTHNSFEYYNSFKFNEWRRVASSRSGPLSLNSNETYLLRGIMKEQGGGDFLKVGFQLPNSQYLYNESKQVVRQRDDVRLRHSSYVYEQYQLDFSIDIAEYLNNSNETFIEFNWEEWTTKPLPLYNITFEMIEDVLTGLFVAQCSRTVNVSLYDDHVYDFEVASEEGWVSWDSRSPQSVEYESYCGRYSLEVKDGRAQAFQGTSYRLDTGAYPYLCMAYKVGNGTQVNLALKLNGIPDWQYVPLVGEVNSTTLSPLLPDYDSKAANKITMNDQWNYTCSNLDEIIREGLGLSNSSLVEVEGFGFYADDTALWQQYYIDQLSFSSELIYTEVINRAARPNGMALHSLRRVSEYEEFPDFNSTTTLRNVTVAFEIHPSLCHPYELSPILANISGSSLYSFLFYPIRTQSAPVGGTFVLSLMNMSTQVLPYDADNEIIKQALNEFSNITGKLSVWTTTYNRDRIGRYCPGRNIHIQYVERPGPQPSFELRANIERGSANIFQAIIAGYFSRPIPGHMLRTAETTPQLLVNVKGRAASCSGGRPFHSYWTTPRSPCSFYYRDATPPENVTAARDCPSQWMLYWHTSNDRPWIITRYEIVYWEDGNSNDTVTINLTDFTDNQTDFILDLSYLELDREYLFKLKPHSIEGPGNFSGALPVFTGRCLPAPPTDVLVDRDCPHMVWMVSWIRVQEAVWNLTKFQVLISSSMDSQILVEVPIVNQEIKDYTINITTFNISNEYTINISAVGIEGTGKYSTDLNVHPPRCVPTPPWNLTVTRQCPYTWVLSWNEPNFTNVDIIGFQIRFIAADSPTRYLDVAATSSESSNKSHKIDLYGLNMSQEHSIQVSSVGIEGLGNYSEIFYFFPQRCIPPPPILGIQRHCPGPWELVWQNDLHGRGWVISQYEVMRTSSIGQTELFQIAVVEQNQTFYSLTMDDLDVDGEYNFTVRGFTGDGPGNFSVVMRYQPERCVPFPPVSIYLHQTEMSTLVVTWSTSDQSPIIGTHFEVMLKHRESNHTMTQLIQASVSSDSDYQTTFVDLISLNTYLVTLREYSEEGPSNYTEVMEIQLSEGCSIGLYNPPFCIDQCKNKCGSGNPCASFTGTCQCNSCWEGIDCVGDVSSLCFEDYLRASNKKEKLVQDFGNSIPVPPKGYLDNLLRDALNKVSNEVFDAGTLLFDVEDRDEIAPRPLAKVSFIVDYSINTNNARSGIDKIVGLVQKGIWKATLIQQDHPKSKITINV